MNTLSYSGRMRFYFNRHGAAPRVWCVAGDGWEVAVTGLLFEGVRIDTKYKPKAAADADDGIPSAWIEASGRLEVLPGGLATVTRVPDGAAWSDK